MYWALISLNLFWWEPVPFTNITDCSKALERVDKGWKEMFPLVNPNFSCEMRIWK